MNLRLTAPLRLAALTTVATIGTASAVLARDGTTSEVPARLDAVMTTAIDRGLFHGVVCVIDDGEVVYERAHGSTEPGGPPITLDSPFYLASISKQFTAAAVMLLAQRGELGYDDPVARHVDGLPEWAERVTVRHLLTNTSGLGDYLEQFDSLEGVTNRDVFELLRRRPALDFEPGARYGYSNSGYVLLALLAERVAESSFREFTSGELFAPLGMTRTTFDDETEPAIPGRVGCTDRYGRPLTVPMKTHGAGGLYSSARDLVRWHDALFDASLLEEETLAKAWTSTPLSDGSVSPYGFGWHVHDDEAGKALHHTGGLAGYRHFVFVDLAERDVVILLTNRGDAFPLPPIATAVTNVLRGREAVVPPPSIVDHLWAVAADRPGDVRAEAARIRTEEPDAFRWSEEEFNDLGYALLEETRFEAARGAFLAGMDAYPDSGNLVDSYAECCLREGLHEARAHYLRSLELDPTNDNARAMLARMDALLEG